MQARIHQRWLDKRERKKQEREQRQELARQNEHRYIHANNWLLNMIIKTRIIIFKGLAGKGKTLLMQVFTKFLVDKFEYADRKNRRYNKLMNPNYIEQREKLKKEGYLPVYSNMEGVEDPETHLKAQTNAQAVLKQKIKVNSPAVVQLDEIGSEFGKQLIYSIMAEKDKTAKLENTEFKEFGRKLRHYGAWLLGTEQDGDDIVKDIRQFGFTTIEALDTKVELSKKGKFVQGFKLFFQKWTIGYLVSKIKFRFSECLFFGDYVKTSLKLLLPGFWANEKQYYLNRNHIYEAIKNKYTVYKTLFLLEGKLYWLYFTNAQKLCYDTLAYKPEYDKKFDKNGIRKELPKSA